MSRPTISLAMIVKNEAHNLPQVFASIEGCFDEVVIVDTGSTDDTVAIAEKYGAKVHHFTWIDDFAAARNYSFSKVTSDYVAWMDGDDVLENKENFIRFRDDVMKIADYWVAPYHYASDKDGNSVCTFVRERVMKATKGFKWQYFVHEGVNPNSGQGPIQAQTVNGWAIRHKRTDEDMKADRSRNLSIFEKNMAATPLDARMRYYYGKELFESGNMKDAVTALGSSISDASLELHDRVLATQYLCSAYMAEENYSKTIDLCQVGILIDPNRAEFWCIWADAYLKQGNLNGARVLFQAAKSCMVPPASVATAIFYNGMAYSEYPMNQLAKIYFHMGDLNAARKEAAESVLKHGSSDARAILLEIDRIYAAHSGYDKATACDDIVFTTPPQTAYEFDPGVAAVKSMGGSETAMIEMARWLHQISGRKVKVFSMRKEDKTFDGVEYINNEKVLDYMAKNQPYLHIAWRHNIKMTNAPTFVWCHDLETPGAENTSNYDKLLCLTPFHKNYAMVKQNIPEDKIWITSNGLIPERFEAPTQVKDPNKFVFSSSPDRGLDRCMRVLDKVRLKHPDIKLHIFYGIEHLDKYGLTDMKNILQAMMDERKDWVIYHGATQQDQLMEEFKTAAYCVQPSDWIETSKITALEMACAGIYQITRAVGGCVDTLKKVSDNGMATLVDSECLTELEYDIFIQATFKAIEEEAYKRVSVNAQDYSWEKVARSWLEYLPTMRGNTDVSDRCHSTGASA